MAERRQLVVAVSRPLWWVPGYPPDIGGIETFARLVCTGLAERGFAPDVFVTSGGPSTDEVDGLTVIRAPLRQQLNDHEPSQVLATRREVARIKSERRPSLYHVHVPDPFPVLHLTTRRSAPAPTVTTLHNENHELWSFEPGIGSIVGQLAAASDVMTAVSPTVARLFARHNPQLAHRMVTIPNGVVTDHTPPTQPTDPTVLALGRLTHQKGFDRLIAAMPAIVERVPEVTLTIAGVGPELQSFAEQVERFGLGDRVRYIGPVDHDQVIDLMARHRVVVTPSRHEGLCLVAVEAGLAGRPVVATDVAGLDYVVEDDVNGKVVADEGLDEHPARLADAIVPLLLDAELADRLGVVGRRRAVTMFDSDRCVDGYATVYRSVFAEPVDVAVVIPVRDGERHLRHAIDSALAEIDRAGCTGQVVVVDDGSTDGTRDLALGFGDGRITVFTQPPMGGSMARNAGLALSRSEFVAHLDHDDVWPEGRLASQLAALRAEPDLDAVFGRAVEFADDAPAGASVRTEPFTARGITTALIRRRAHDRFGGFAPVTGFDGLTWCAQAIDAGLTYRTTDELALHRRIHATNHSHRNKPANQLAVVRELMRRRRASSGDGDAT